MRWALDASGRRLGTLAGLAGLCGLLWILTPYFLTVANALNVMEQTSINAIVAVGMTFVIVSGGIDLSVGSLLAFAGVVLAGALNTGWPIPAAVVVALGAGAGCGLINGLLIALGRLPPFIATLGMMSVARGATLLATDGRPISGFEPGFRSIATGRALGVPSPILVTLAIYAGTCTALAGTKRPHACRESACVSTRRWCMSSRESPAPSLPCC